MTIVVLLILVLVWAVVLGPSLLRRGAQRRSTDSIGDFHRQLRVLERAGPSLVDPIHSLDTTLPSAHLARTSVGTNRHGLIVVRPDAVVPVARHARRSSARRPDPYFRPEACKRRRDVLVALFVTFIGSGVLGAIPQARPVLILTALTALAMSGYIALLVRLRNRAHERELKLRYLPRPAEREASIAPRRVAAR